MDTLTTITVCFTLLLLMVAPASADCSGDGVAIVTKFSGGSHSACQIKQGQVELWVTPEDAKINPSPWYAMQITSDKPRQLKVKLNYAKGFKHRYWPKQSTDLKQWQRLDQQFVMVDDDAGTATFIVEANTQTRYLAGQELYRLSELTAWMNRLRLDAQVIGKSAQQRPLYYLQHSARTPKHRWVVLARQHPPEATGSLALEPFIEQLLKQFKDNPTLASCVQLDLYPMVNPDGVELGYWRHGTGHTDLNRDWGPFRQVESKSIWQHVQQQVGIKPTLMLDFHSTNRDVLYTQMPEKRVGSFTERWVKQLQKNISITYPDYIVNEQPGHSPHLDTTKTHFNRTFGIDAITFELGDETDRQVIKDYAIAAADALVAQVRSTESCR